MCNAPSTFQRSMTSIFSNLLQDCMEVFMDDFKMYATSFNACMENPSKLFTRCIDKNLVLNFEKCHFMVTEGIVLGHLVPLEALRLINPKSTLSLPFLTLFLCGRFSHSLDMQGSIEGLSRISTRLPSHCPSCYKRSFPGAENLNLIYTYSSSTQLGNIHSSSCVTPPIWHSKPS
ncbi:Retrovirus-related Pol polyprotein, partial [Mucuna pruriens]